MGKLVISSRISSRISSQELTADIGRIFTALGRMILQAILNAVARGRVQNTCCSIITCSSPGEGGYS